MSEGRAYYNEIDPYAAQWLRNLIAGGHIAPGDVDERSIVDVRPADLVGYTQCHFFAGIGVWSYALRLAGWTDDRPVWTGSCPCPPFSTAGKGQPCPSCGGKRNLCHPRRTGHFICLACGCDRFADDRHLWPEFSRLIRERRPSVVFGEQVASQDGRLWLDVVSADLRLASYGFAGANTCSAGYGAPHIRQRLRFVAERGVGLADACGSGLERKDARTLGDECEAAERGGWAGGLAHPNGDGTRHGPGQGLGSEATPDSSDRGLPGKRLRSGLEGSPIRMADDNRLGRGEETGRSVHDAEHHTQPRSGMGEEQPGPTNGFWRDADWLFCRDDRWRPVEPGTFPLAHGSPARVGRLRGYGNAVDAQATAGFIEAYLDTLMIERSAA